MSKPQKITVEQVRSRSSEQSFGRGQSYYQGDAVFDTIRRGDQLEGYCEGSQPNPYRILVTLEDNGIGGAFCTCPYDWGGDCKHIVALLLTYIHDPDAFEERPALDEALQQRSKDELIALIREMIDRQPDLEMLVDRPVPGHRQRQTPVNTESYRKELRHAIRTYDGWGDRTPCQTVYAIARTAGEFAAHGDWKSARAIYSAVLDECQEDPYYPFGDDGDFFYALGEVLEGLVTCLEQETIAANDAERQAALLSLLGTFLWDVSMGGYGLGDEPDIQEAILKHARPGDIAMIREIVEAAQKKKLSSGRGSWGAEALAVFLIELDAIDNVDPEVILKRLKEQGLYRLLFGKLLQFGRFGEAIALVEEHLTDPFERLEAALDLTDQGQAEAAIRLAEETIQSEHHYPLADWLLDQYRERGEQEAQLRLLQRCMTQAPSLEYYVELENVAKRLGRWKELRLSFIERLEGAQEYGILARIYLHEQEWDLAWEIVENSPKPSRDDWLGWRTYRRLDLEVAEASRFARPRKAIPIYIKHAHAQIGHRKRDNYHEAASYLVVVKQLYHEIDDESAFEELIAGIRTEFKRLPALQDELRKAGL